MTQSSNIPSLCSLKKLLSTSLEANIPPSQDVGGISYEDSTNPHSKFRIHSLGPTSTKKVYKVTTERDWDTTAPQYKHVLEWVKVHWSISRETQQPPATAIVVNGSSVSVHDRLDDQTATKKLITAAKHHGVEIVSNCATAFAQHGTIVVYRAHLLKGPPISTKTILDDNCCLLPYNIAQTWIKQKQIMKTQRHHYDILSKDDLNVCALQSKEFHFCRSNNINDPRKLYDGCCSYCSPVLLSGIEVLTRILSLSSGRGYRLINRFDYVPVKTSDTLPFLYVTSGDEYFHNLALTAQDHADEQKDLPLATAEVHSLSDHFSSLNPNSQQRLDTAMKYIYFCMVRDYDRDIVVDLCIILEILFTDNDEDSNKKVIINRVARYYASTENERTDTETLINNLYDKRNKIVHGEIDYWQTYYMREQEQDRTDELVHNVIKIIRTCTKSMITNGIPKWNTFDIKDTSLFWPYRPESEILSERSDSLSWSINDMKIIDHELKSAWSKIVDKTPLPPERFQKLCYRGIRKSDLKYYMEHDIPYIVVHPALLYKHHPKWPKSNTDNLDVSTVHNSYKDVVRHMELWGKAAVAKKLLVFRESYETLEYSEVGIFNPKNSEQHRDFLADIGVNDYL